jgi:hypothetical protein
MEERLQGIRSVRSKYVKEEDMHFPIFCAGGALRVLWDGNPRFADKGLVSHGLSSVLAFIMPEIFCVAVDTTNL